MSLYHASPRSNRESILQQGLLTSLDRTGYGAVFLTDKRRPSDDQFDIWLVECPGLEIEPDDVAGQDEAEYGRWWMSFENIPVACLTRVPGASQDEELG